MLLTTRRSNHPHPGDVAGSLDADHSRLDRDRRGNKSLSLAEDDHSRPRSEVLEHVPP